MSSGRKGEPFSGSQCRRGALFPLVSPAQLCPCRMPPLRNGGWLSLCGPEHVSRALAAKAGRVHPAEAGQVSVVPLWGPKPNVPSGFGLPLRRWPSPSASLSPLLFLLPMSSVFEGKVKRANVPDLSDIISCSGSLLGINKINLMKNKGKQNKQKRERERERQKKRGPQTFGCKMRWSQGFGFSGSFVCLPEKRKCQPRTCKGQVGWGTGEDGQQRSKVPWGRDGESDCMVQ